MRGHHRGGAAPVHGHGFLTARLWAALDAYLFQPAEAVADLRRERHAKRATPAGQGNELGTNRKTVPKRSAGNRYTSTTYYQAIQRACDKADRAAKEKARAAGRDVADDERLVPR